MVAIKEQICYISKNELSFLAFFLLSFVVQLGGELRMKDSG